MRIFGLLFLLPLLLFSCKRLDGDTLVEGKVEDKHTGAAVPYAWVEVYGSRSSGSWGGYAFVEKHQANENGDFGFQFEGKGDDYLLKAYTELGHSTSWNDAVSIRQGKNNKKLKLKVDAPAWVKIILKDELPIDFPMIYLSGFLGQGIRLYNVQDTTILFHVEANKHSKIFSSVTKSGIEENSFHEEYFPALDTTTIEIKF